MESERMKTATGRRAERVVRASRRGRLPGVLVVCAAFAAVFALGASSASAALVHKPISSFNGEATPAHSMFAYGVAVDNSSSASAGDVYVSDGNHGVVDKFSGLGGYLSQLTGTPSPFGLLYGQDAVNASGDVFVPDLLGGVDEFGPSGESVAHIPIEGLAWGVAVNGAGEVFVASFGAVYKYDPVTLTVSTFATGFGEAVGVAVDDYPKSLAYGHVYVVDQGAGVVDVFDSSGTRLSQLTGSSGLHNAVVDLASGDVYVGGSFVVHEFSPAGALMSTIPTSNEEGASVAVNATSGDVYVAGGGGVEIFGPGVIIPDTTTSAATGVQPAEATLHGHVDPAGGGEVTSCRFEYGTSTSYGKTAPCSALPPYTVPADVSATVGGLSRDTVYHYRLAAGNANGTNESEDGTFETTGPPSIGEERAVNVAQTHVAVQAQIDPHGFDTTYYVQYGETESYGKTQPISPVDIGPGVVAQSASQELTGLKVGTVYHYRFVATNAQETVPGPDQTVTTIPPATVKNEPWDVAAQRAVVKAEVNVEGASSSCVVRWVSEAQFVASGYAGAPTVPCTPGTLGAVAGEQQVLARLQGLQVSTTYHFEFVISNEYGQLAGPDQTFTTFGLKKFTVEDIGPGGLPETQAGAHPYKLVTKDQFTFTGNEWSPSGNIKDVRVQLPPGLVGNPIAVPRCTVRQSERFDCPAASEIGLITILMPGLGNQLQQITEPLFNMFPPKGYAADFGAKFSKVANAYIVSTVRTGRGYGIESASLNITPYAPLYETEVVIWGVPADPRHDGERECRSNGGGEGEYKVPPCSVNDPLLPLISNPTSCSGPLTANTLIDSYQDPGEFVEGHLEMPGMIGCEKVRFGPSLEVLPETTAADSPGGMHVLLHVPQEQSVTSLAEADVKDVSVTLPEGVTLNPAGADGLLGCSEAQIELHGPEPARCPAASRVGSIELTTPVLDHTIHGSVYAAQQGNAGAAQGSNPFGSLIALYLAIEDPQTGVIIKVAGNVTINQLTGQLTATFANNPQLPFENLKLDFFGGPRGPLATPRTCGSYTTTATMTSWAAPSTPVSLFIAPFSITSGPGGSPCPAPGFTPVVTAGTQSNEAGGFSPLSLSLSRKDGEQTLGGVSTTLPAGVAGMLAKVPLCGEAQANAGECPAGSEIGHVTGAAGVGSQPIMLPEAGRPSDPVYLTGPYKGAPFGLAFLVHAEAGAFNLGKLVVRARIIVDPHTAQVTVLSDPLPTIMQGVPLDVRSFEVIVDREAFTFNPTSCEPKSFTGTVTSALGATANISSRFQATDCAALAFKPKFSVSTSGKTSRANGASLAVKLTYPSAPQGTQANIARVKVDLPKQLPSRLTTLQKACTATQFESNPAGCPAASLIGHATVHTPLLAGALSGPAIFVSHGGEAFPSLIIVLQGEGVTLDLVGTTFISKAGITSSTYKTVPDAPVGSFELTLPEGKYSALAANGNLCTSKLAMPTELVAQNGLKINESTPISVTGCAKKKTLTRAQKLAAAMKACHKKAKGKRAACAAKARKQFGPIKRKK